MNRQLRWLNTASLTLAALMVCGSGELVFAKEPTGTVIDSPYQAVEANSIELVTNADGDVVQIRTRGCPQCTSDSILPSRELIVESGGEVLEGGNRKAYSGLPGVIHVYHSNNMAYRVSFVTVVKSERGGQ